MPASLLTVAYISAGVLFILSLGGLSHQETARRGNQYGMLGMLIAVVATAASHRVTGYGTLAVCLAAGSVIGAMLAARVAMTNMPELVAILHSFVGLAAVLVGFATHLDPTNSLVGVAASIHEAEIFAGIFVGALTFTGSVIAFGKLRGSITSRALLLPGRNFINLLLVGGSLVLGILFVGADAQQAMTLLLVMTLLSSLFGVHMVMAIGGADMPVVVSMLNSYSGWAAAAAGFMLNNDLLIITGALVGSSGAILSHIMCKAMNRSFLSVIFGTFGATAAQAPGGGTEPAGEVHAVEVQGAVDRLNQAKEIVIVPGYGMAVAQAQHPLSEVTRLLRDNGAHVRFAIHPVAGRLPGHMNVLLAEAKVPYDIVLEMDEINEDFAHTDVVLVIGANDIVNPAALEDASSPIYGMPVLRIWEAGTTIVMKRGMSAGYAGIDNPLFYKDNTLMLFGDAKKNVDAILAQLRQA